MMSALETVQRIFKIGGVLSKVAMILLIVAAAGCVSGIAGLSCIPADLEVEGEPVRDLIEDDAGMAMEAIYGALIASAIVCIADAVVAYFAMAYFRNEQDAGTPFTFDGANEMMRLGVITVVVPVIAMIIASASLAVMDVIIGDMESVDFNGGTSIMAGIVLMVFSVVLRYGAELREGF